MHKLQDIERAMEGRLEQGGKKVIKEPGQYVPVERAKPQKTEDEAVARQRSPVPV